VPAHDVNPYSDEKAELQAAWQEGYQAGCRNEPIPEERIHNKVKTDLAWMEGYVEAQLELSDEI
jgi:hypothetical protein